jgi:hypothetical protein
MSCCGFRSLYKNSFLKNKHVEVFLELDKNYDRVFKQNIEDRVNKNQNLSIPDVIIIANNDVKETPASFDQSGILISNLISFETTFYVFEVNKDLYDPKDYVFDGKKEFGKSSFKGVSKRDSDSYTHNSKLDSMILEEKQKRFLHIFQKLNTKHTKICEGKESFTEMYINNFNNLSGTYQQTILLKNNMAKKNAESTLINIMQKCKK